MDTNPFATNANTQQQPTPSVASPNMNNGSVPGGIAAMIQALMAGNDQYKMQQQKQAAAQGPNPLTTTGGPSVGTPMSLSPPTDPATMTGGLGQTGFSTPNPSMSPSGGAPVPMMSPMGAQNPFTQGASPVSMDPVTNALMSPIPGM